MTLKTSGFVCTVDTYIVFNVLEKGDLRFGILNFLAILNNQLWQYQGKIKLYTSHKI